MLSIQDGIIMKAIFYGDFMAVTECTDLEMKLRGTPYQRQCVHEVLKKTDLRSMFGEICAEDIEDTFFA